MWAWLTLKAPIATKVVCFIRLMKFLKSLYDKQSTLFASILKFVSNDRQLFSADDFSRHHFSDALFLSALRAKS